MEWLVGGAEGVLGFTLDKVLPFLVALTVLVFIHELGHYLVARWCGVRVEVFSVGFGSEVFGWTDSHGTRWKFSWIPIGGYVKMFGEMLSPPTPEEAAAADPEDERVSFHTKPLWQRAAIVFAGPFANFLLAVLIFATVFSTLGERTTPADISKVVEGSAAERAGMKPGDIIRSIDGTRIERFEQVVRIVQLAPGETLRIDVEREGRLINLIAVPDAIQQTNRIGMEQKIGRLGVSRGTGDGRMVRYDVPTAFYRAVQEMFNTIGNIFQALGQMISGTRDTSELGGPIRIAQISGEVWQAGAISMIMFVAALSINLGLINLFPVPMLDGGHLMFYAYEAVAGRPMGERAREYGFRIGIAMVLGLMVFATWNDLLQLRVFELLVELVT